MEAFLCLAAVLTVGLAATGSFNYSDQAAWGGSCNLETSKRQSPIAIANDDAVDNDQLLNLELSLWNRERDGVFYNTGTSVKFTPDSDEPPAASTTNHLGTYDVLQFHMHWGAMDKVGSAHVVDGTPASAEIHFVHQKRGDTTGTRGDSFAVVGVMAVANDSEAIAGVWSALNVEEVQGTGGEFNTTVNFYDLLPSDRSYYYYEGSLTTPNCSEVVQWFLLEETISIPRAYLAQLREVEENEEGDPLTFNYRSTQDLAGRQVSRYPASPSPSPSPSSGVRLLPTISLLSMLLLAFHALL